VAHWEKTLDAKITARLQTPLDAEDAAALGLRDSKAYGMPVSCVQSAPRPPSGPDHAFEA